MSDDINEAVESPLPEGVADGLREQHGPIVAFEAGAMGAFAFRAASQAVHERMINKMASSDEKAQALREYCASCLCYPVAADGKPDYKQVHTLFQAAPALPTDLLSKIQDLEQTFDVKKL